MLNDDRQRQQATDPTHSYLLQAPAGSGKTEILTQRYLRLLARVKAPEQIVAITFTRKAANEMRERILKALEAARKGITATSIHQEQTLAYARLALERDHTLNWQLLQQPGRLSVTTIDALCQTITRAIPLQDKQVPYASISDKPLLHYQAAALACLTYSLENKDFHQPLRCLLHHVDNRQDTLVALFSALLANRDQWLPLLYQPNLQDKAYHEHALSLILDHELTRFKQSLPSSLADELLICLTNLANLDNTPDSPRSLLRKNQTWDALSSTTITQMASVLLTSQSNLRRSFDHHVGLKRGNCSDSDYTALKSRSQTLCSQLAEIPDFLDALRRVKALPNPEYDPLQWQVLQALLTLLPLLVAHLQLIFNNQDEVDFSAIATQALQALGEEDCPTDLALYLDNSIEHLLVDEFQDTSLQQFHLLSKLVQGWQQGDQKTLFIVGDPMQSIYRFRSAEVGLFLRAKYQGIGPLTLTPLELTTNFRSTSLLVDWVNTQFRHIFPTTDDLESGAVSFHPSEAIQPAHQHSSVQAVAYATRAEEAQGIVALTQQLLNDHPSDTIAILVRSRHQLKAITQALRTNAIPFQGVEIDLLANLPHIRDVWTITKVLLLPANRLSWLALLRSPWCGLALPDLLAIAEFSPQHGILSTLAHLDEISTLSEAGRLRAQFLHAVFLKAFSERGQTSLIDWIIRTLNALQMEHVLSLAEQEELEQYWQLLSTFEQQGQLLDLGSFQQALQILYSQQVTPSRLQIMTIHKSKGLEFDTVILPGLGSKPTRQNKPLLQWLQLPSLDNETLFLLSPIKSASEEVCLLYDYISQLDDEKNQYELQRLLYVAITRAKQRLYLLDHSDKETAGSARSLLKHQPFISIEADPTTVLESNTLPTLYHLPLSYYHTPPLHQKISPKQIPLPSTIPRLIGIVVHDLLQWICDNHPTCITAIPWHFATDHLRALGFEGPPLDAATTQLKRQISAFLSDPIGLWIAKAQEEEHTEYALLVADDTSFKTNIIDRTFIDAGVRWIIDFKTGHDQGLAESKHRQQLNAYAALFDTRHTSATICCGIYYLDNNHWVTWSYSSMPRTATVGVS